MLEVRALTRRFSGRAVVDGVSFTVAPSEILGCLGPNGAGKSTLVRMIIGLVEPSSGDVLWRGRSVAGGDVELKQRLGYVPEEPNLYPHLSGREYLELVGRLRGIPERLLDEKIGAFLRLFGLEKHGHARLSSYSKGMRQKVLIAAALLDNPDVLVLDEPLSGLDVESALVVRNLIQALAREGRVVLFSSHVLEVVEKICANVLILHRGRVRAHDSVARLRELLDLPSLEDVFRELAIEEDTERIARDLVEAMKLQA